MKDFDRMLTGVNRDLKVKITLENGEFETNGELFSSVRKLNKFIKRKYNLPNEIRVR